MFDNSDTIPSPPPEGCVAREADEFVLRLMRLPREAGTRRPTTWEKDHERDPAFNARGCR